MNVAVVRSLIEATGEEFSSNRASFLRPFLIGLLVFSSLSTLFVACSSDKTDCKFVSDVLVRLDLTNDPNELFRPGSVRLGEVSSCRDEGGLASKSWLGTPKSPNIADATEAMVAWGNVSGFMAVYRSENVRKGTVCSELRRGEEVVAFIGEAWTDTSGVLVQSIELKLGPCRLLSSLAPPNSVSQ